MKKSLSFLIVCLLIACSGGFKEKGEIKLKNGEGQEVSIPYQINGFTDFSKIVSKDDFFIIVQKASDEAKTRCKYKPTYVPVSIDIFNKHDTITTLHSFTAKNAFGVPDELRSYCKFKGTDIIDSF